MAVILGVLVAMSYGSGDFLGGRAARSASTVSVLAVVQIVGIIGAIAYVMIVGGDPTTGDLGLGALAGIANVVALGCLYAGMATGRIGLVAPLTAVVASCIPVIWGLTHGESLSGLATIGAVLAVASGGVIAYERHEAEIAASRAGALGYALVAGVMFGWSLVAYSETSAESEAWPLVTGRAASLVGVLAVALILRLSITLDGPVRRMAVGAGVLDVTATAVLLVSLQEFDVAIVAPLAALAPAFTVTLASLALHEKVGRIQIGALAGALAGLTLIAGG